MIETFKRYFAITLCTAASLLVGCADDGLDRVGISGHVIYEGAPLEGAEVLFRPQHGPNSSSLTDETGRYQVDNSFGPVSGSCEVRVMKTMVPEGEQFSRNVLPAKFSRQPKIIKLEQGQNSLDLDLDTWDDKS
ncbi:carboxypeptidase-like regulatory domain-containing protein [Blastopirellula retiformator]|uniref:Nickel uptake substrate-specific transmembrane region n=1 Tax=Blastopirellula retiformator TaxID=2527970 RepID=A0A5C5V773_9BACT|nr:carboxypeptidase-like regulatory domain-containing protein [Blastopirellula retiformator]TWT34434.1 hypothetical protein Enr8_18420 [Blastopirellula retiformator]